MERDHAGAGDPRLDEQTPTGGYEAEAAQRHREKALADLDEIRPNQLAPGPLSPPDEAAGAEHFEQLNRRTQTKHASK